MTLEGILGGHCLSVILPLLSEIPRYFCLLPEQLFEVLWSPLVGTADLAVCLGIA